MTNPTQPLEHDPHTNFSLRFSSNSEASVHTYISLAYSSVQPHGSVLTGAQVLMYMLFFF